MKNFGVDLASTCQVLTRVTSLVVAVSQSVSQSRLSLLHLFSSSQRTRRTTPGNNVYQKWKINVEILYK